MSKNNETNDLSAPIVKLQAEFKASLAKIEEAKTRGPIALLEAIFQNLDNCDCLSSTTYEMDIADYCIAISKLHCLDTDFGFMLNIDTLMNYGQLYPHASAKVIIESADINQVTCVVTITNKHEEEVAVFGFNFRHKTKEELIRTDIDSWMFALPDGRNNIQPARDLHLKGVRMISRDGCLAVPDAIMDLTMTNEYTDKPSVYNVSMLKSRPLGNLTATFVGAPTDLLVYLDMLAKHYGHKTNAGYVKQIQLFKDQPANQKLKLVMDEDYGQLHFVMSNEEGTELIARFTLIKL